MVSGKKRGNFGFILKINGSHVFFFTLMIPLSSIKFSLIEAKKFI